LFSLFLSDKFLREEEKPSDINFEVNFPS